MSTLRIYLFGRLRVEYEETELADMYVGKVQDLFCYLLLYPGRPHLRETLASQLWHVAAPNKARRYLSKALWKLQSTLASQTNIPLDRVLTVDPDWIQLELADLLWLDADEFERAFHCGHDIPGRTLKPVTVSHLAGIVELYSGDLLEGCYLDWCLYERERFRQMHLIMLDKLMEYYEAHGKFETSLIYGTRILKHDQARERTHRRLMRLHYLAGDRTSALRQYERCAAVLEQELGVEPAAQTSALYEQIRAGQPIALAGDRTHPLRSELNASASSRQEALDLLEQIRLVSDNTQSQIREKIDTIAMILGK